MIRSSIFHSASKIENIYFIIVPTNASFNRYGNIYRIDDFVGTVVGDIDGDMPRNIPVNIGGHTGYWTDPEVRAILVDDILSEFATHDATPRRARP